MVSARAWRPAHSVARALAEVRAGIGAQFCPDAAWALIGLADPAGGMVAARRGAGVGT